MSRSINEWWQIIQDSYGGLENFDDVTTVREMRKRAIEAAADDVAMVFLLKDFPEAQEEYETGFAPSRAIIATVIIQTRKWLVDRHLPVSLKGL